MKMARLTRFSGLRRKAIVHALAVFALCLLCAAGTAARAQDEGTNANGVPSPFVTFVVPTANQGTIPWSINANGDVAGVYADSSNSSLVHGFVRTSKTGAFTTFDVPGATKPTGSNDPHGTIVFGIDAAGDVVGMFTKGTRVDHGFVRAAKTGAFTIIDIPGAGTGRNQGTIPVAFDGSGGTLGFYLDANYVYHGFHRTASGAVTYINDPHAGTGVTADSDQGTLAAAIDASGTIVGRYQDANSANHGFIRTAGNQYTTIDVTGAGKGWHQGTVAVSIDAEGNVAGLYWGSDFVCHGYVRNGSTGAITTFRAPNAGTLRPSGSNVLFQGTAGLSIQAGVVTGSYMDASGLAHGFVRAADGVLNSFDAPGASVGEGFYQGTMASNINPSGVIAGGYTDAASLSHGYLYTPATLEATTTTLAASPNPSVYQEPVTFTAHVSSASGAPPNGEEVGFLNGARLLGTEELNSGEASYTTTALPVATGAITAEYAGNTKFASSTSNKISQAVKQAATTTALTSSVNPSASGKSVTLTATVTGKFGGKPSGSVTFNDGSKKLGSVTLSGGKASYAPATLAKGRHSLTAVYSGDASYTTSTGSLTQTVN